MYAFNKAYRLQSSTLIDWEPDRDNIESVKSFYDIILVVDGNRQI